MPWIMRAKPEIYDLARRLEADCWIIDWSIPGRRLKEVSEKVQVNDRVWFAVLSGAPSGGTILARGKVLSEVVKAASPKRDLELPICPAGGMFGGAYPRVFLEIQEKFLSAPFQLADHRDNAAWQDMKVFSDSDSKETIFWLTDEQASELERLMPSMA